MQSADIVKAFLKMEAKQDINGMKALMADDIVYEMPFGLQEARIVGKEKLVHLLTQFIGKEHGMYASWELYNFQEYSTKDENLCIVEMDGRGIVKQNGFEYLQSYISLFRVNDDQITWWKEYFNPIRLQAALASLQE